MRRYFRKRLINVSCNCCGQAMAVEKGIVKEGNCSLRIKWDYFSEKDGEIHHMDLCESCYDRIVKGFIVKPDVLNETELL